MLDGATGASVLAAAQQRPVTPRIPRRLPRRCHWSVALYIDRRCDRPAAQLAARALKARSLSCLLCWMALQTVKMSDFQYLKFQLGHASSGSAAERVTGTVPGTAARRPGSRPHVPGPTAQPPKRQTPTSPAEVGGELRSPPSTVVLLSSYMTQSSSCPTPCSAFRNLGRNGAGHGAGGPVLFLATLRAAAFSRISCRRDRACPS